MKFTLTKGLKEWAVANLGLTADASDADFKKGIAESLAGIGTHKGKMTVKKLKELTKDGSPATPPAPKKKKSAPAFDPKLFDESVQKAVDAAIKKAIPATEPTFKDLSPADLFAKGTPHNIRVVGAAERYSKVANKAFYPEFIGHGGQSQRKHALAGRPVEWEGHHLEHTSDLGKAVAGAWFKKQIAQSTSAQNIPRGMRMTKHDEDLLLFAVHEMEWSGVHNVRDESGDKIERQKLTDFQRKSILDDTISGGIEAAPVVFDDALILFPLLYGELFPFVNVVNISQGRRVKGASMQNPTMTSGIAEGTAIQPFSTSGFIGAFDTAIFPMVGSVLLGLDFEEDTPIGFGSRIVTQWGMVVQQNLDKFIAIGDGVTQPLGIFNTVGYQNVNSDNGPGGRLSINDLESLMFGLQKQYRFEAGAMTAYIGNDLGYRRFRKIPVGPGDERRVQGMDYGSYTAIDRPYKVQNDITTGQFAYANLKRYRMYRRLGMTVRVVTEGLQLATTNQRAIVVRMRFGGQMETGNAVALMLDGWQ